MKVMKRKDKAMDAADALKLLVKCEYGILSTVDDAGQPYGVPLNYVYRNDHIYFHCALSGHKIENIETNPKISFCAVGDTSVVPSEFSTEYESVVVFGRAAKVEGTERNNALAWLLEKYSPEFLEEGKSYLEKHDKVTKVIKISIEHISGKRSIAKTKETN